MNSNKKRLMVGQPQVDFDVVLQAEIQKLQKQMQDGVTMGMVKGSHLQCSTILKTYENEYNKTPEEERTTVFYDTILHKIFDFCRKGCSKDMEKIIKGLRSEVRS